MERAMRAAILLAGLLLAGPAIAETGRASYYGSEAGSHTFNGERFRPHAKNFTCAHRTLPMGTVVEVKVRHSGKSARCRINDRGPASWTGKIIDVCESMAIALGFKRAGSARVTVTIIKRGGRRR